MPSSDDTEIQSPNEEHSSHSEDGGKDRVEEEEEEEEEEEVDEAEEVDDSDASSSIDQDGDDANKESEPGGHEGDMIPVCSSAEKIEAIPPSDGHNVEDAGGGYISVDRANKSLATHLEEVAHVNDGDLEPSVSSKPVISASEHDGTPESASESKNNTLDHREKKKSLEASEDVQNNHGEADDGTKPTLAVITLTRDASNDSEFDGVKPPLLHTTSQSSDDFKLRSTSSQTPQQRPRSGSLGAEEFERQCKRPVIICNFFARGWCIKGKSCRFLHQKDSVDSAGQWTKGDFTGASRKGEEVPGVRRDAIDTTDSSKSHFLQERFGFLGGGESRGQDQVHDHGLIPVQREDLSLGILPGEFQPFHLARDDPRIASSVKVVHRENPKPEFSTDDLKYDTLNRHDPFPSSKFLQGAVKMHQEMPKVEHLHDETFVRGSPLIRNESIPNYRFFSAGSSLSPNIYSSFTERFAPDRSAMEPTIINQKSQFSLYDAHPSSSLNSSLNTSFSTSIHSMCTSPSLPTFGRLGSSSTRGSTPFNTENMGGISKLLECDMGYSVSGSTAPPQNSSSSFLRPEAENLHLLNAPGSNSPVPGGYNKTYSYSNSWAPSIPFRSSFVCVPAGISSPGSQYDPLLDSIEPPNGGKGDFQASILNKGKYTENMPPEQTNGDHVITGERGLLPPHESRGNLLDTNFYRRMAEVPAAEAGIGSSVPDTVPEEEKAWSPGHLADIAIASVMDRLDGNLTHQTEGGRSGKDPKTLKYFRTALVEFVKELVKPSWREGHLSKDAHKMVVKKAVDRVISTLQPHQIPGTPESVAQYLSSSRNKISKLVEGYVEKYAKP